MTCYLFGAAPVEDCTAVAPQVGPDDFVICADGGYRLAQRAGVRPDLVVGDFDSSSVPPGETVVRVDPVKDHTDLSLAVEEGRKRGYREFVAYGVLGGRFDHSMATVQLIAGLKSQGIRVRVVDARNELFVIQNETVSIPKNSYRFFSLFSLTGESRGVSITGAAYPLENAVLESTFPLGVSNEVTAPCAEVTVASGMLLVVFSND